MDDMTQTEKIAKQRYVVEGYLADAIRYEAMAGSSESAVDAKWAEEQYARKLDQAEMAELRLQWLIAGGA